VSVTPKSIVDYLIGRLKETQHGIRMFSKGEPPQSRYVGFPFLWVEWVGGPQTPATTANCLTTEDRVYIVYVARHPQESLAEDSVMDAVESLEKVLVADQTLGGQVRFSYVSNREKEKTFSSDYSVVAVRLTLSTVRKKMLS